MTISAPIARASDTGTGFTSAPSTRIPSLLTTGVNRPGIASDARTAFSVEPVLSQTSAPFSSDVATAAKGICELLDRPVLTHAADERHESLAFQQPAAHGDVHERNDVAAAHTASPGAEAVEFAGGVAAPTSAPTDVPQTRSGRTPACSSARITPT